MFEDHWVTHKTHSRSQSCDPFGQRRRSIRGADQRDHSSGKKNAAGYIPVTVCSCAVGNSGELKKRNSSIDKKITYLTWFDVVVKHLDIFISVGSGLLVNKANGVHHFMNNCTHSLAAVTNGDILFSTLSTHKRVTPTQTKKNDFQWCAAKLSKLPSQ